MNITIINKKENPLLSRTEIKAELIFESATPSRDEFKKAIAAQLKTDEKLTIVKNIYTRFGESKADALIYIYLSKEEMEKIEPRKKEKRKSEPNKTPKEEPKKEAKQE